MPVNAAPDAFFQFGGDTISGPELDDYHCIVTDASRGLSSTGKAQVILEFTVKDDKNHPSMEGKKLSKAWFTWPAGTESDTDKKRALYRLRRMLFEGLGVSWPKEGKTGDPRIFSGKQGYCRIGTTTNKKTGKVFTGVTHIVQDPKKFPAKVATDKNGASVGTGQAAAAPRRRAAAQPTA